MRVSISDKDHLFDEIVSLIKKLRNNIEPQNNFMKFDALVKANSSDILAGFNVKWLTSICDTYADFGDESERRNALYITFIVATTRLADTLFKLHDGKLNMEKVMSHKQKRFLLYDGVKTLHIDKQDTLLNLAKRVKRNMRDTPFLYDIFTTVISRIKSKSYVMNTFILLYF